MRTPSLAAGYDPDLPEIRGEENRLSRLLDLPSGPGNPFLAEALAGLRKRPKELPCKYFYDQHGSELFDQICLLPEYYPTRKESEILGNNAPQIAQALGPYCELVEYGSGNSSKTRILLDALPNLLAYYPIDISCDYLHATCEELRRQYPELRIEPICADYTGPICLPDPPMVRGAWETQGVMRTARRVAFFPGSTIGNFPPDEAVEFLRRIGRLVRSNGALLIGVDLKKDLSILEPAYDDAAGVTARFNLNVLARMNRELEADFELSAFRHLAFYNPTFGRMEMHLVSLRDQVVHLGGEEISFEKGETIWTESSYKYTLLGFSALAARSGFHVERVWTDADRMFSVQLLVRE